MLYNVGEIFAVPQIILVLLIALIVFGPNRLPEIGKQIGNALRDIKKASSEVARNFNTDFDAEPDVPTYSATTDYAENRSYSFSPPEPAPPDLTDYTIVGAVAVTPATSEHAREEPVPEDDPYRIAPVVRVDQHAVAVAQDGANTADENHKVEFATSGDASKEGEHHV